MGKPKAALRLPNGETMGERAVALLRDLCRDVLLLGTAPLPEGIADLPRIEDRRPGEGPLAGLEALLASGRDTAYLVIPCDMPLLDESILRLLVRSDPERSALFAAPGSSFHPFPLRINSSAGPDLTRFLEEGGRTMRRFLESLSPRFLTLPAEAAGSFRNVNEQADLDEPELARRLPPAGGGLDPEPAER